MIRVRRSITERAYMVDNGSKVLYIDEDRIDQYGMVIRPDWAEDANDPIDTIHDPIEVGHEDFIDNIPPTEGMVVMCMSSMTKGWLVLTYNHGHWNFGSGEYTIAKSLKNQVWKVLAL